MKIIRDIGSRVPGERVLAVTPPIEPYTTPTPRQPIVRSRMNLFPHRALTHVALTAEQRVRMTATALLGQAVAPGIIDGFEVALEGERLLVMPGHAVTRDGEDVELAYPMRLNTDDITFHPAALSAHLTDGDAAIAKRIADGESIRLGDLLDGSRALPRPGLLPRAMVLVAQPVTVAIDRTGELDSPCANATGEGAYSQLAWEDGFRLLWVPWPADQSLPPWTTDGAALDARFRNRLAYAIFNAERERLSRESLRSVRRLFEIETGGGVIPRAETPVWPWEAAGAPLAVIGFDGRFRPAFSDRAAVARQGGGRRNRSALVPLSGDDVLWQARVAQLVEHLAEIPPEERDAANLARQFDWLPPAGVLPKDAADFAAGRQYVFPPNFDVQAQPVPLDMADALIAESSPLLPFNLSLRDQVQILVPVPARYFEPDLLKLDERIHPLFDLEVARLERSRLELLTRRDGLRRRLDTLARSADGKTPSYPEDDENALPDESGALDAMAFARVRRVQVDAAGAAHWHGFKDAHLRQEFAASDSLIAFVRTDVNVTALGLRINLAGGARIGLVWGHGAIEAGAIDAGDLPPPGEWTRLAAPVSLVPALGGATIDNVEFGVLSAASGCIVDWGHAGRLSQGQETYWLGDALPPGAVSTGSWDWVEQGAGFTPEEDAALGLTIDIEGTRHVAEADSLVQSYSKYLGGKLSVELGGGTQDPARPNPRPVDAGLSELIQRLQTRIDAASDHIEFGFLRARTDIFRIRQSVLGVEEAGRFLTSPTAAELVKREENPIATEKEFAEYFKRASSTPVPPTPKATPATAKASVAISTRTVTPLVSSPAPAPAPSKPLIVTGAPKTDTVILAAKEPAPSVSAERAIAGDVGKAAIVSKAVEPKTVDVSGASLIGATLNTVTVGERLSGSASVITSNTAAKGKSDFVLGGIDILQGAGLVVDDIGVYGYKDKDALGGPAASLTVAGLKAAPAGKFVDFDTLEPAEDLHEAGYFKRGIDAIDNMVRFLRGVELRAEDYRRMKNDASAARDRILAIIASLQSSLSSLATRLAEVRHDLAVARSLRAEEIARVAQVIARRKSILQEHVPFLVFRRPRLARTLVDLPVLAAEPAVVADPVPRCRKEADDIPPELRQMVDTLREVPARWFKRAIPLFPKFDRVDLLQSLASASQERLGKALQAPKAIAFDADDSKTARLLKRTFSGHDDRVQRSAQAAMKLLGEAKTDTWKAAIGSMKQVSSVADLIRAAPSTEVTLAAAGLLDDIAGVAGCLYDAFSRVPPATRLRWAELFSELDSATRLRSLTVLPDFGDERTGVDYIQWRQMQIMVDWLFQQIEADDDAVTAINDLVRVCILLAAHAPVRRIISARVRRPVIPAVDAKLELDLDPRIAKIGMQVLVHAPATNSVVARAVLEDIASAGSVARITQVMAPQITVDATMRVQVQAGPPLSTPSAAKADRAKADSVQAQQQAKTTARKEAVAQKQSNQPYMAGKLGGGFKLL